VRSAIVATQGFHMTPALWLGRRAGLEVHGLVADRSGYGRSGRVARLREVLARVNEVGDVVTGSGPRFPGPPVPIGGDAAASEADQRRGGAPSWRGRPSSHTGSQGGASATKEWYWGARPGSSSSAPSRTETSGPRGDVPPKRLEPQRRQKALAIPPGAAAAHGGVGGGGHAHSLAARLGSSRRGGLVARMRCTARLTPPQAWRAEARGAARRRPLGPAGAGRAYPALTPKRFMASPMSWARLSAPATPSRPKPQ
jgi:hypothetical protein